MPTTMRNITKTLPNLILMVLYLLARTLFYGHPLRLGPHAAKVLPRLLRAFPSTGGSHTMSVSKHLERGEGNKLTLISWSDYCMMHLQDLVDTDNPHVNAGHVAFAISAFGGEVSDHMLDMYYYSIPDVDRLMPRDYYVNAIANFAGMGFIDVESSDSLSDFYNIESNPFYEAGKQEKDAQSPGYLAIKKNLSDFRSSFSDYTSI